MLMLRNYHPDTEIYLFGVDCVDSFSSRYDNGKIVKEVTTNQINHIQDILQAFKAQRNDNPWFFDKIWNCNPDSKAIMIEYKDYRSIYG